MSISWRKINQIHTLRAHLHESVVHLDVTSHFPWPSPFPSTPYTSLLTLPLHTLHLPPHSSPLHLTLPSFPLLTSHFPITLHTQRWNATWRQTTSWLWTTGCSSMSCFLSLTSPRPSPPLPPVSLPSPRVWCTGVRVCVRGFVWESACECMCGYRMSQKSAYGWCTLHAHQTGRWALF